MTVLRVTHTTTYTYNSSSPTVNSNPVIGFFSVGGSTLFGKIMSDKIPASSETSTNFGATTYTSTSTYTAVVDVDLSTIVPSLAGPARPQDRVQLNEMKAAWHRELPKFLEKSAAGKPAGNGGAAAMQSEGGTATLAAPTKVAVRDEEGNEFHLTHGDVVIAAITSCTNTSNPRNVIAAGLLARNANRMGLTRKPWVKTSLAPGSKAVALYLDEAGLTTELERLGFGVVAFACTTCNGMSGALDPAIQKEIIERDLYATAVLSGNRNFDGRIHPYARQAFLASPPLVVAYAIAGTVRVDIEKDPLGVVDGKPVMLKDLWPTDAEIDAVVRASVKPEQFRKVYTPMFDIARETGPAVSPLYDWRPQSTYIRRPPYWEGALAGERTLRGMRPLAVLGDNITTDHLSPSNAIQIGRAHV
jgi:aconitate hydratase